jgi:putative endonuclease
MAKREPTVKGLARRDLGQRGENAVAAWYAAQGFDILDRNWRCREGEIDVVAAAGDTLVICEVKTRSSDRFGSPFEAVTITKQRRLRTLAARWLVEHKDGQFWNVRFDVAAVMGAQVDVIENAF